MCLENLLNNINSEISEKNGQIKEKTEFINKTVEENKNLQEKFDDNIRKKLILQKACETAREFSYDAVANIATLGLQEIFGTDISVEIVPGEINSTPTANFMVRTKYDGYETLTNPTESDGGGVADIVSLAAFLCINILNDDRNSAPLFLDEPTKFVSAGHAEAVAKFIQDFAKDNNKQIIMVTHANDTENYADATFKVALDDTGKSIVEEVSH